MALIRTYDLGPALLHEHEGGLVRTVFKADGAWCDFAPPRDKSGAVLAAFVAAAAEMGYSDPVRYAVEHEAAHHIVATARGLEVSSIVWGAAHGVRMSLNEPDRAGEEHLVNALQRFMNSGEMDSYGCLESEFGNHVAVMAADLLKVMRPWVALQTLLDFARVPGQRRIRESV